MATKERRNISQQLYIIVDDAHDISGAPSAIAPRFQPRNVTSAAPAGLSAVIED